MRILELTNFSAGICGVWGRVKQESEMFVKDGHEVLVCSSDRIKGRNGRAEKEEEINGVKIRRFGAIKFGGESFMRWNPVKVAVEFKPDVIFAHSYRHWHNRFALKIAEKTGAKVFLVTHAPFEREESRSVLAKLAVNLYDIFIGPKMLQKFNKIVAITKWEYPHLHSLGLGEGAIEYIPNGIPVEFFNNKFKQKEEHKILFFGRVAPIKQLDTTIRALNLIDDKKLILEMCGPEEKEYSEELRKLILELNLSDRIKFSPPIFNIKDKIEKINSCEVFALPSKSEGMPQGLIEAMACGKIVVSSDNLGAMDLISSGKNGLLFKKGDVWDCKQMIEKVVNMKKAERDRISKNSRKSVEKFKWDEIVKKIEKLIKSN